MLDKAVHTWVMTQTFTPADIAADLSFRDGWPAGAELEDSPAHEMVIRLANGQRFCIVVHELEA